MRHDLVSDNTALWNHDVITECFLQELSHFLMIFFCHTFSGFYSQCEWHCFPASPAVTCQQRSGKSLTLGLNSQSIENPFSSTMTTRAKDSLRGRCNTPHHDQPEINSFSHLSCFSSKTVQASVCLTHLSHHVEPRGIPAMCLNQSRWSLQAIWALLITSLNAQPSNWVISNQKFARLAWPFPFHIYFPFMLHYEAFYQLAKNPNQLELLQ